MSKLDTRVIQVTNVAPATSKEQLKTLFQFIGRIREIQVFPPENSDQQVTAKVCYIEFDDATSAGVALHLTNTVFIDRALIVVPVMDGKIPDEKIAMQLTPQTVARIATNAPAWPSNVVSQLAGAGAGQMITTYDPRLAAMGLPQYPPLAANIDAAKVEEIRRTVYVGNLDPETTADEVLNFFSQVGEVKYVRFAGVASNIARGAYIEWSDQRSVALALGYNGANLNGRVITVTHAKNSITKPISKSHEASKREIDEAMKKVKEAQSLISAAASDKSRSRSRSRRRSRSRGYSRSRSRDRRRSRSRSRGRRRHSRSRTPRRRSRTPRRRRSRTRSPRRRRSRSRRRRSRSTSRKRRSRTRSPKRKSKTPPRAYSSRRSRSRPRRKSRSGSRSRGKDKRESKGEYKKRAPSSRSPSPPVLQKEESSTTASQENDWSSPGPANTESSPPKESADKPDGFGESMKKVSKPRDRSKSPLGRRGSVSPGRPIRKRSMSRSPVRGHKRSPSPIKRRSKSRSPRRSRSPMKKKKTRSPRRSRSGSRHRSKKDKKRDRSRSRDRKDLDRKKKPSKDPRSGDEGPSGMVTRDYDEEEKGFNSNEERDNSPPPQHSSSDYGVDRTLADMDTSD